MIQFSKFHGRINRRIRGIPNPFSGHTGPLHITRFDLHFRFSPTSVKILCEKFRNLVICVRSVADELARFSILWNYRCFRLHWWRFIDRYVAIVECNFYECFVCEYFSGFRNGGAFDVSNGYWSFVVGCINVGKIVTCDMHLACFQRMDGPWNL